MLFFLILLFPLAFFATGHVTGKTNIPQDMELSFRIGSLNPIYVGYSREIRRYEHRKCDIKLAFLLHLHLKNCFIICCSYHVLASPLRNG